FILRPFAGGLQNRPSFANFLQKVCSAKGIDGMNVQLDAIDRKILRLVQQDSRSSMQELADKVGLSASACHRRVKGLEERGLIERYRAVLDATALGFTMQFFIEVSLSSQSE